MRSEVELDDVQVLALTALGEARGDRTGGSSLEERIGCMLTVRNRLDARCFGDTIRSICLRPRQYASWTFGDPNRDYILGVPEDDTTYTETRYLARGVIDRIILDFTRGATHYYSPAAMKPAGSVPFWAKNRRPCAEVGCSKYFRDID